MLLVVAASPNRERVAPEQRIVTVVPDLAYRGNFLTVGLWQSTPLAALYWTFPHGQGPVVSPPDLRSCNAGDSGWNNSSRLRCVVNPLPFAFSPTPSLNSDR